MKKEYHGKAIYQPSGKAAEYGEWACNFHIGCSNWCDYCYCSKALHPGLWSSTVTLKKAFKDEQDAIAVFKKELSINLQALRGAGLFFSFTTDPLLPETMELTAQGVKTCVENGVNVKVLTKRADFIDNFFGLLTSYGNFDEDQYREHTAFGFTLTGHDELERGASSNIERIGAMEELHNRGYRIFASIEPIVDFPSSMQMIKGSLPSCAVSYTHLTLPTT